LPPVGNDIVDLAAPGNPGKSRDGRFCKRVFTQDEQALIAKAATRPDALLWALWAAKEAAYKAVSRGDPTVCSIPRQYRVVLNPGNEAETSTFFCGKVITPGGELALRIAITTEFVHALAAGSEAALDRICWQLEEPNAGGDPSSLVREALVREIARRLECPTGDLSVVNLPARGAGLPGGEATTPSSSCLSLPAAPGLRDALPVRNPGAPGLLLCGRLLAAEFSLSHDGRFAAFAFDPATLVPTECAM
jgi:phosphopantetheine--protein transferase-like protein